jgi:predicted PurR-regulated permease PerM
MRIVRRILPMKVDVRERLIAQVRQLVSVSVTSSLLVAAAPAAILLALDGAIGRAALVAGLGFGVVSAVDNVLRPALLSGGAQMNGLVILIALLGGISAFGVVGVVIGPIVLATTIGLLDTYSATEAP